MRQLKNSMFSRVLAEDLKNGSTDFHQTYVLLSNHVLKFLKLKIEDRSFIVAMITNSSGSAGLKIMI